LPIVTQHNLDTIQSNRERKAKRSREIQAAIAEIGELPSVGDPELKEACRHDLFLFLTSYFPESTGLSPFSQDHKDFIKRLQASIEEGGRELDAVYRGFAKTTIGENTVLWVTLYGHAELVPVLGFDKAASENLLDSIKTELTTNELLARDFPEVCYPISKLEGKWQRARSQTYRGVLTEITWTVDEITFPVIDGFPSSGVRIVTKGFLKCPRGLKHKMPDGRNVRPRWVFIDDPQDDESARSPDQCAKRIDKLYKTILKLGGHTSQLSVFIAATCIEVGCFVSQLMDKEVHASFSSHRVPMVRKWSKAHETLWVEYGKIRANYDRADPRDRRRARAEALKFYQDNQKEMDAGCLVSWEQCYSRDEEAYEISAIQHAYNMWIDDGPDVFECECQNNPQRRGSDMAPLEPHAIAAKTSGYERYEPPPDATHLTAFIDIQGKALYYAVMAWTTDVRGYVMDYGTFPGQKTRRFSLRTMARTLAKEFPGADQSGAIFEGLQELVPKILDSEFLKSDGTTMKVSLLLIDANWGEETETVKNFCEQIRKLNVFPTHGRGIEAEGLPITHWQVKPGEYKGENWIVHRPEKRTTLSVSYDTNYFKTLVSQGLLARRETTCSLHLYKETPSHHRQIADHCCIEVPEIKIGRRRTITSWEVPKHLKHHDNHWWDCVVGCRVAASMLGISTEAKIRKKPPKARRKKVRQ